MKASEKIEKAVRFFKKSYAYKMGGTQTVILPNGKSQYFDDREYYSGRGAKYNSSIKHHHIGEVKVSRKEYAEFLKMLKEREEAAIAIAAAKVEENTRIIEAKAKGIYSFHAATNDDGNYIELSDEEIYGRYFDADRLAKTLDISIEDAELLKSEGKTYVFAKTSAGKIIELYHPSLSANHLSIWFDEVSEEKMNEFDHDKWASAPFAKMVGMTSNKNHFVC